MSLNPRVRATLLLLLTMSSGMLISLAHFTIPVARATTFSNSSSSLSTAQGFSGWNEKNTRCATMTNSTLTCVPPDVQVAVGSNYVMELVNSQRSVYTKQGLLVMNQSLPMFFNVSSDLVGDPALLFDSSSQRWFASALDFTSTTIVFGVSTTNDPTAPWNIYSVLHNPTEAFDQPTIGVSDDKFVVSINLAGTVGESEWWVYNKSDIITGVAGPRSQQFGGPLVLLDSVRPVQTLSSTSTEYMVSSGEPDSFPNSTGIHLFSITGTPGVGSGATMTNATLSVSVIKMPPPDNVTTDDYRVTSAAWFRGKLWLGLNTSCTTSNNNRIGCIRVIQIDTTTSSISQDIDYFSSGQDYFYPALSIDNMGNLDMIYGYYPSSSLYPIPSLAVAGQAANDPVNSMIRAQTVKQGLNYNPASADNRYGDYFGAAVDPSDPTLVWVAGEYVGGAGNCLHQAGFGNTKPIYGTCWNTYITYMRVRVTVGINSSSSFLGFTVSTNGSLTIDSALSALTASGKISVFASNSTTGVVSFSKTYTIMNLSIQLQSPGYRLRFILRVGVNSCVQYSSLCTLSADNFITYSGTAVMDNMGTTRNIDINQDGAVNQADLNILNASYHCSSGQTCYNPQADLTGDGIVDISDLSIATLYITAPDYV